TRQIRSLETQLGAVLLVRSSHGVTLTPAGVAILPHARQALAAAAACRTAARDASGARPHRLALATGLIVTLYVLPPVLAPSPPPTPSSSASQRAPSPPTPSPATPPPPPPPKPSRPPPPSASASPSSPTPSSPTTSPPAASSPTPSPTGPTPTAPSASSSAP